MNNQESTPVATLGKALQEARLKASLAVEEVAVQLNLAISTVRDIEDDLDHLIEEKKIPTIYLRGYIANYAKLVTLEDLAQFSEYQQLLSSKIRAGTIRPHLIPAPAKKRGKKLVLLLITMLVVGAIFFAVQYFLSGDSNFLKLAGDSIAPEATHVSVQNESSMVVTKKEIASDNVD